MPLLPLPSTGATVNNAAIGAVGSIPLPPPSTTTTIAAINDHHRRCHTVDDNDRQKPAAIVRCQQWQWRPSSTEAVVDGNRGNGSLC
jgi:hypothetical protein